MKKILLLLALFIFNIIIYWLDIIIFNDFITNILQLLISLLWVYFFTKLLWKLKYVLWSIIFIIFVWFILWFLINEIPSYSIWIWGLFLGIIFSSILYLKIFKNDIFNNVNKNLKFIISTQLLFIFLINLFLLLPFSSNFKAQKQGMILNKCFEKVCYNVYYMKDGFFFWGDYMQVSKYYNNVPFIIFNMNILNKNIKKIKINKEKRDYIMEYILNSKKYSIKL